MAQDTEIPTCPSYRNERHRPVQDYGCEISKLCTQDSCTSINDIMLETTINLTSIILAFMNMHY